jgi:cytochrome c-type biogenesis protein CcmF
MVVHLGVVLIAVALAASSSYISERELVMEVGDEAVVSGHRIELVGMEEVDHPNRSSTRAHVAVDGRVHTPSIDRFFESGQQVGTPSVQTGPLRDVYLTLARVPGEDAGGDAVVRVIIQPLVMWLWIGGGVMGIGTLLAVFPGRRRLPTEAVSAPVRTGPVEGTEGNGDGDGDVTTPPAPREPQEVRS